jgi:benzoyl-CoA 2,3-dioxygenase component A
MSLIRQHLIDPEICIRCNTCEETCPVDAVTHNDDNYAVDAAKCEYCLDCIAPCPTGAIDNWRVVAEPYSLEEQFSWDELPEGRETEEAALPADGGEALDEEAVELIEIAHQGEGGKAKPPASASRPQVNLYTADDPAIARVMGNYRITAPGAENDVRHVVLDFGSIAFPVIEGQSVGVIPQGTDAKGRPHRMRLYSVSSARDGERPNHNNVALTVKRDEKGVASNYICDLAKGDEVKVTGPYGATFLMPNDPKANIIMICTGTGSAPFRAFTERRRRTMPGAPGKLMLFFGARRPEELPYFGPLKKVPADVLDQELVFSRLPDRPKEYVQDRLRARGEDVAALLRDDNSHIFVCGLKGMEGGVAEALADICRLNGLDWAAVHAAMLETGRFHVETY